MVQRVGERHVGRRHPDGHREPEREPSQLHREHDEEHQTQPERGHRSQQEAVALDKAIDQLAAVRSGDDAQREAQHAAHRPRNGHERERIDRARCDDVGDRGVEAKRHAHVAPHKIGEPVGVALPERRVHAPVLGKLRALGLAHVDVGRLPHVRLHRIDGRNAHQHEHHHAHSNHEQEELHYVSKNETSHESRGHPFVSNISRSCRPGSFDFSATRLRSG